MTMTNEIATEDQTVTDVKTDTASTSDAGIAETIREKLSQHGADLKEQALGKAREYADQGKEKATDLIDSVARFFDTTANSLDDRLEAVGTYAHNAAGALGDFAESLRNKDFETLVDDAKAIVRRNPAIAIGTAAVLGFVMVRLIKSAGGTSTGTGTAPDADDIAA